MKQKQIVYKLIREQPRNILTSIVVTGKAAKIYKPGIAQRAPKWLAERGYYITAFRNRRAAHLFAMAAFPGGESQIWRCEATEVIPRSKLPPICWMSDLAAGTLARAAMTWPTDTVMCKTIKLLKRVE